MSEPTNTEFREKIADIREWLVRIDTKVDYFNEVKLRADQAYEKADQAEANAKAYTSEHAAKTDNPHKVTKAQIGLSNVDDVQQASKIEFKAHDDDTTRHITAD
ncbi:phage baseplate upper protein, partial [Bacillus subtilis]|nr:phage baseplate upper protein [Bacillus subtilis]